MYHRYISMSERLPIRSIIFVEGNDQGDEIVIPQRLFSEWLDFFPHGQSMLATLEYQGSKRLVCIGSGHASEYLYCPQWIISHLGSTIDDESLITIEPFVETLPLATRIVVKILEPLEVDLRSAMETYLDRFHVLQSETTLALPLQECAEPLCVYIEAVEPPGWVGLGGEVILEFVEEPVVEEPVVAAAVITNEQMRLARIKRFTVT